ncbi:hypothetical protein [Silvibacterium sp.]|uniref:hypothetical protein n=1 Tax=Silvibacterium sp. TaxID=1964179 RepID=UPI0039E60A82
MVGFLSPWLLLIRFSPARIPLAIFSCGLAIACGFLIPGAALRVRYPEARLEPWSAPSQAPRIWLWLNRICGGFGLAALLTCIFFLGRPHHHGEIDWSWTLMSTGMMFNFWSLLIASYRLRRNAAAATAIA